MADTFGSSHAGGIATSAWLTLARWRAAGGRAAEPGGQPEQALRQLGLHEPQLARMLADCQGALEANIEAIGSLDHESADRLSAGIRDWRAWAERVRCLRAVDGNIVLAPVDAEGPAGWLGLADLRGDARRLCAQVARAPGQLEPVTIAGLRWPWLLAELLGREPEPRYRSSPLVRVVEPELGAALAGLSLQDLTPLLGSDGAARGLRLFVGDGAIERFAAHVSGRDDLVESSACAGLPEGPTPMATVRSVLADASRSRARRSAELGAWVEATGERSPVPRTASWWAERFERAARSKGPPLRVLVLRARFSTFIGSAAADIACAARAAGCVVDVLEEPDDHSVLAPTALAAACRRSDPDLIISINRPRQGRGERAGPAPADVPWLCWVQDAMPHLREPRLLSEQSELDFYAGYATAGMFAERRTPKRAMAVPVGVSGSKFHDGPVSGELAERFACDIAYASNQSETPREMVERLRLEAARDRRLIACFDDTVAAVAGQVPRGVSRSLSAVLREKIATIVRARLGADDEPIERDLLQSVAMPLADRVLRHEMLSWAARIARRRGWRLHLYGIGWEGHPVLAPFARGVARHGEELRAAYACAGVHLHASAAGQGHQRLAECAMSGGLALCRLQFPLLWARAMDLARRVVEGSEPDRHVIVSRRDGSSATVGVYSGAAAAELITFAEAAAASGGPPARVLSLVVDRTSLRADLVGPLEAGCVGVERAHIEWLRGTGTLELARAGAAVLGAVPEACFVDEPTLERLLDMALREGLSPGGLRVRLVGERAEAARQEHALAALWPRLVEHVRAGLAEGSGGRASAVATLAS